MEKECCDCSRRQMLRSLFCGSIMFPAVLSHLLSVESRGEENPLAPKAPHFPGKAKRVIFIYLPGGASHVDSFDYKPKLIDDAKNGRLYEGKRTLLAPYWEFKPRGKSGIMTSDLFPHIGDSIDDISVINSMHGDHNAHFQATMEIHSGSVSLNPPSVGSWGCWGLGRENQTFPAFVVFAPRRPVAGGAVWGSGFLPGVFQAARVVGGDEPVAN